MMQTISNVIYAMQSCFLLASDRHCKSCPYYSDKEPSESCDAIMAKDAIQYLDQLRKLKETDMTSTVGVPVLPVGYINKDEQIKEPKCTLDEVISAFDHCRAAESCADCPYREDDICGDSFGNDAKWYLEKYRESIK